MKKVIDINKILKDKNPKLEKWMPAFIINYLKRIFHQDEINQVLHENKDLKNFVFCDELIKRFNLKFQSEGLKNIPKTGGVIFVINHPLGGFDALGLAHEISKVRPDVKFMVNDVMMNFSNVEDFMVGVNKHGAKTKDSVKQLNELFTSDNAVLIFPAGLVSRRTNGIVVDSEWKKTFVVRAKKFQRNIVPIHISGELSNFFYSLSNLLKKLGVKANIEMMYLANETFKLKNKSFKITFGKPIGYETFDTQKTDLEWASEVKNSVYNLNK
jgi:1-acyl-sn-glycerol-3-phosphate acyltransferase